MRFKAYGWHVQTIEDGNDCTAIEKAITARRPKARYSVSASAKLLLAQRAVLSDRVWDAFLRGSFPSPGAQ